MGTARRCVRLKSGICNVTFIQPYYLPRNIQIIYDAVNIPSPFFFLNIEIPIDYFICFFEQQSRICKSFNKTY